MPILFNDAVILGDGYNFSGDSNSLALNIERAELDSTTFGQSSVTRVGGLKDWNLNVEGFWNVDPDSAIYTSIDNVRVMTMASTSQDGAIAYSGYARTFSYSLGGGNAELMPFTINAMGAQAPSIGRGTIVTPLTAKTATGVGVERQLGALSSTQSMYAFVHVTAVSGTTPDLDVVIQSDDNAGFTTPITRITLNNSNSVGAYVGSVAGAVTDTYWRVSYTIGGTTPSFTFSVNLVVV